MGGHRVRPPHPMPCIGRWGKCGGRRTRRARTPRSTLGAPTGPSGGNSPRAPDTTNRRARRPPRAPRDPLESRTVRRGWSKGGGGASPAGPIFRPEEEGHWKIGHNGAARVPSSLFATLLFDQAGGLRAPRDSCPRVASSPQPLMRRRDRECFSGVSAGPLAPAASARPSMKWGRRSPVTTTTTRRRRSGWVTPRVSCKGSHRRTAEVNPSNTPDEEVGSDPTSNLYGCGRYGCSIVYGCG